jgi:hypothetical protein
MRPLIVKATFVVTLKSNLRPIPFVAHMLQLQNELRLLLDPRFAYRVKYQSQGLKNQKFNTKLTLFFKK